jgi:hypothetical protein
MSDSIDQAPDHFTADGDGRIPQLAFAFAALFRMARHSE